MVTFAFGPSGLVGIPVVCSHDIEVNLSDLSQGFIDNDASGYISMEEFSPEHYNVLMSFKEWASGLYGSVGNAFKNFDKEGDGALTLSILRRACQKGKWSGDPQKLFDSVGDRHSGKDLKLKQITVEDVSFLDLWPDREDQGEDQGEELEALADADPESSPEHHSAKILPLTPTVFERLYQVPAKRCRSAPSLVAFALDPMDSNGDQIGTRQLWANKMPTEQN